MGLAAAGFLSAVAQAATKIGEAAWARNSANHAYRQNVNSAKHAHQWEMEDLRAAGLNPILTANGGASASAFLGQSPVIDLADAALKGEQSALAKSQQSLQQSQAVLNYANSAERIKQLDAIDQSMAESRQRQATGQAQQSLYTQQIAESMHRQGTYGPLARLYGAQAVNQMAQAGYNSAQATNIGMQNDWLRGNPAAFDSRMRFGVGSTPYGAAAQVGSSIGQGISWGLGHVRNGLQGLGNWLGSFGSSGSSARSVDDNSGLPF